MPIFPIFGIMGQSSSRNLLDRLSMYLKQADSNYCQYRNVSGKNTFTDFIVSLTLLRNRSQICNSVELTLNIEISLCFASILVNKQSKIIEIYFNLVRFEFNTPETFCVNITCNTCFG